VVACLALKHVLAIHLSAATQLLNEMSNIHKEAQNILRDLSYKHMWWYIGSQQAILFGMALCIYSNERQYFQIPVKQ